jgi:hypothetical protein
MEGLCTGAPALTFPLGWGFSLQLRQPRDDPTAMDGRAARERRTSLFYAELGANLCEQVFQLVHFSFETRDVGLHRREFRDAEGWRLSR